MHHLKHDWIFIKLYELYKTIQMMEHLTNNTHHMNDQNNDKSWTIINNVQLNTKYTNRDNLGKQ